MIKQYRNYIIGLLVAFGVGYYLSPTKVVVETKTRIKTVTETKIKIKTVKRELPSGEKITTTVYQNDTVSKKNKDTSRVKTVEKRNTQWAVALGRSLGTIESYYLAVDRRILGNAFVGVYTQLDSKYQPDITGFYLKYSF